MHRRSVSECVMKSSVSHSSAPIPDVHLFSRAKSARRKAQYLCVSISLFLMITESLVVFLKEWMWPCSERCIFCGRNVITTKSYWMP